MEELDLIKKGTKVKGFKFETYDNGNPFYNPDMNKYIDKIGLVISYNKSRDTYNVDFLGETWEYPSRLLREYIVEEEQQIITDKQIETITLPLINGVPDLSGFEGVEMLVSNDKDKWDERRVLFYYSKYAYPYVTQLEDNFKYAKHLPVKKKITVEDIKKMFNCDDFEIV